MLQWRIMLSHVKFTEWNEWVFLCVSHRIFWTKVRTNDDNACYCRRQSMQSTALLQRRFVQSKCRNNVLCLHLFARVSWQPMWIGRRNYNSQTFQPMWQKSVYQLGILCTKSKSRNLPLCVHWKLFWLVNDSKSIEETTNLWLIMINY